MCLQRIDNLSDNLGNRFDLVPFLDDEHVGYDYFEVDESQCWVANSNNLICVQLNICGLINKQGDLLKLINKIAGSKKVDVITLQETWITNSNLHLVNVPGYKYYGIHRKGHNGGGVSIFVSNELTSHEFDSLSINENCLESCFIEVKLWTKKLMVGSIYSPPNTNDKKFNENGLWLFSKIKKLHNYCTIVGTDHNLDLMKNDKHLQTQIFLENILSSEMIPCITHLTRITRVVQPL